MIWSVYKDPSMDHFNIYFKSIFLFMNSTINLILMNQHLVKKKWIPYDIKKEEVNNAIELDENKELKEKV